MVKSELSCTLDGQMIVTMVISSETNCKPFSILFALSSFHILCFQISHFWKGTHNSIIYIFCVSLFHLNNVIANKNKQYKTTTISYKWVTIENRTPLYCCAIFLGFCHSNWCIGLAFLNLNWINNICLDCKMFPEQTTQEEFQLANSHKLLSVTYWHCNT